MQSKRMPLFGRAALTATLTVFTALVPLRASAQAGTIEFGAQPWPGVTVKTEVAMQILEAMGYQTKVQSVGNNFVYQGLATDDLDVSFGAWLPAHQPMLQPLLNEGSVIKLATNLEGAIQGLAVPAYVYKSGIKSMEDLVAHGERFDYTIYAIGAGAAMTKKFVQAVKNDYMGLGNWNVVPSSTAAMLAQVGRFTRKKEPVVFHGWAPHWMNIKYNLRFLKAGPKGILAHMKSTVYTVASNEFPEKHPEVAQFLEQFQVSVETQSQWIYDLSVEGKSDEAVARQWIKNNLDTIAQWLQGVQTASGGSGIKAVRRAFSG